MTRAALIALLVTGAACAQTITNWSATVKTATLGTVACTFWMQGNPTTQAEIAVSNNGLLDPTSIMHFPAPANGTAIFPCPAPLDRFQIAVSATGVITASIVPLPPPPTQAYSEVVVQGHADGINKTFLLPTVPNTALLQVSINGLVQGPTQFTFDKMRTITFTTAPAQGAEILALYQ